MILRTILFTCLLAFLCSCAQVKPSFFAEVRTDKSRKKQLNTYFTKLAELERFNGVVSVQSDGEPLLHRAYTLNTYPKRSSYVKADQPFDIHSVSKLMAQVMLLELEQEGLLSRTDALAQYLPDFPRGDEITIQHLMDNRSGLPREPTLEGVTKRELSVEEIIASAQQEALLFPPGTDKQYSNVGYELLYYIIGQQRGMDFATYVETQFFPKLGMSRSGARFVAPADKLAMVAKNHQYDDEIVQVPNVSADDYRQSMLFATATDLQRFLDYATQDAFRTLLESSSGTIGWTGGGDGVRAHVEAQPAKGYSFVILANYDEIPLQQIIEDVVKIMEDQAVEMPKPIERTAIELTETVLARYVGTYAFAQAGNLLLEVKLENGALQLYQEGENIAELFAETETVFFYDSESADSLAFQPRSDGRFDVIMGWKGVQLSGTLQ